MSNAWSLAIAIGAALVALPVVFVFARRLGRQAEEAARLAAGEGAEQVAKRIRTDAERDAESARKQAVLAGKEEVMKVRESWELEARKRREELEREEKRVVEREQQLDKKVDLVDTKERDLSKRASELGRREKTLDDKQGELDTLVGEERRRLEQLAGLSAADAKAELVRRLEEEAHADAANRLREIRESAKRNADREAKKIVALAVQRIAAEHTAEITASAVALPKDDMKGRIIGREGRNIRSFEKATGVDVIIDDTPGVVIVSAFDPVRREIARAALTKLIADGRRIHEVGLTRADVGNVVRALGDGLYVGERFDGEQRMDVILRTGAWANASDLAAVPVATPDGGVVALGELVKIERTVGPTTLRRVDGRRTVTLNINPPDGVPLEEAIEQLKQKVEPQLMALLPAGSRVMYGGSADSLSKAIGNMSVNFLMALGILFLIMAALFRSARDSGLVMLTIPLATVGGVLALRLLNLFVFTPVDLLTMIGFVILLGVVVNNAILLVHQTREGEREGLARREAVSQAIYLRLRPIFSSTFTGVVGMLPLVFMPGAGSEIYRGLATVIVGGQTISTVFTLVLLPCFLRLGEESLAVRHDPVGGSSAGSGAPGAAADA